MGKKRHRSPEPEKSAFENAKEAFERAGEEDIPVMKTVELSKDADAPAPDDDAAPAPDDAASGDDAPVSDDAAPVDAGEAP